MAPAFAAMAGGTAFRLAVSTAAGGCGVPLVRVSCVSASFVSFANLAASLHPAQHHTDSKLWRHLRICSFELICQFLETTFLSKSCSK
jgi:hypothetical protein